MEKQTWVWLALLIVAGLVSYLLLGQGPKIGSQAGTSPDFKELARYIALFEHLPPMPPIPADNPQTPEKVQLGKMLYYDRRLSLGGETSCLYCHSLEYWGAEPVARSLGVAGQTHLRHSPTVLNIGFMKSQFWDGRDPDLETQALSAIKSKVAMNQDPVAVAQRLNAIPGYRGYFWKSSARRLLLRPSARRSRPLSARSTRPTIPLPGS